MFPSGVHEGFCQWQFELGMGQSSIKNVNFKARDRYTTSISLYYDDGSLGIFLT